MPPLGRGSAERIARSRTRSVGVITVQVNVLLKAADVDRSRAVGVGMAVRGRINLDAGAILVSRAFCCGRLFCRHGQRRRRGSGGGVRPRAEVGCSLHAVHAPASGRCDTRPSLEELAATRAVAWRARESLAAGGRSIARRGAAGDPFTDVAAVASAADRMELRAIAEGVERPSSAISSSR